MGVAPHTPRGTLSAGTRVGRYVLLRRLAKGGMAELYLARAQGLHGFEKLCVLKLVLPHLAEDREFVDMFLREARIAAGLDHPNIAHVSDIGEIRGEPFFVMQYIHGRDLRAIQRSRRSEPLPLDAALTIAASIASGLHYVHERRGADGRSLGLVHRDVSPSNVMVGYDGDVKLVDFGIAKSTEQRSATRTGVLKGKVSYMAPEQCHGRAVDRRTDVFALGILLYEMTTGQRLFAGDNDFYVMTKIVRGLYANPREIVSSYPPALEYIVAKALQVEPEDRFPSAQALQLELEAFAHAEGLRISPLSLAAFMRHAFGEHPLPESVDPLDVAPTEILIPDEPRRRDSGATRMGPADGSAPISRVTGLGGGAPSLRVVGEATRIEGGLAPARVRESTKIVVGELSEGEEYDEDLAPTTIAKKEPEDPTTPLPRAAAGTVVTAMPTPGGTVVIPVPRGEPTEVLRVPPEPWVDSSVSGRVLPGPTPVAASGPIAAVPGMAASRIAAWAFLGVGVIALVGVLAAIVGDETQPAAVPTSTRPVGEAAPPVAPKPASPAPASTPEPPAPEPQPAPAAGPGPSPAPAAPNDPTPPADSPTTDEPTQSPSAEAPAPSRRKQRRRGAKRRKPKGDRRKLDTMYP